MDEGSSCRSNFQDSTVEMNKNPKMEAGPDRLSELPDSLLLQIISRLPIDDAVQTGILSTKWKNTWKLVDEITIDSPFEAVESDGSGVVEADEIWVQKTLEATDRILGQFISQDIRKLTLGSRDEDLPPEVVDKWIRWAYLRNIKVLILEFVQNCYCLPKWFFHSSTLEKMCIRGPVDISFLGGVVSWPSLKSLSLTYVDIGDEGISKTLFGCPLLETLVLNEVHSMTKISIVSSSVKNVQVISDYIMCSDLSAVNAHRLEYLDISGLFIDVLQLTNVSSLLKVNLNLTYKGDVDIYEVDWFLSRSTALLERVLNVEELLLGQNLIQAMSVVIPLGTPCPLLRCKLLTIHIYAIKRELPGIAYLFQISPCLETLVIKVEEYVCTGFRWEREVEKYVQDICDNGTMYLNRQKVDFPYLKNVKILHCSCSRRHFTECEMEQFDFELAAYILRNAHCLGKLVVSSPEYKEQCCQECCVGNYVFGYFSLLSERIFRCFSNRFEDGEWEATVTHSSLEIVCNKCISTLSNSHTL